MAASIDNQDSTNQIETESEEKAKESVEFKNVPKALIQQIENAPNIKDLDDEDED